MNDDDQVQADSVVARPRRVIVGAGIVTLVFCVGIGVGWVGLPRTLRVGFGPFQVVTLLLILTALLTAVWLLALSSVHADAAGIRLRNGFRTYRLTWSQVATVRLRSGDPWVKLVLHERFVGGPSDGDAKVVACMGLQSSDGRRTQVAVARIRSLAGRGARPTRSTGSD